MKIVSCNLNGIRSAHRKGFFDWYKKQKCDALCIQELKAQEDQIDIKSMFARNTYSYFKCAEKKGYSGVSIHSKIKPDKIIYEYDDLSIYYTYKKQMNYFLKCIKTNKIPMNSIKEASSILKLIL